MKKVQNNENRDLSSRFRFLSLSLREYTKWESMYLYIINGMLRKKFTNFFYPFLSLSIAVDMVVEWFSVISNELFIKIHTRKFRERESISTI